MKISDIWSAYNPLIKCYIDDILSGIIIKGYFSISIEFQHNLNQYKRNQLNELIFCTHVVKKVVAGLSYILH